LPPENRRRPSGFAELSIDAVERLCPMRGAPGDFAELPIRARERRVG